LDFVSRTVPNAGEHLAELERAIRHTFIPALLGRPVSDDDRELLSIPARFGGLGISNPCTLAPLALGFSQALSLPLVKLILFQADDFNPTELRSDQENIKLEQDARREFFWTKKMEALIQRFPKEVRKAISEAQQKGASSWVTARPRHDHSTVLHKGDFRDAVFIRYAWTPPRLPQHCVCGANFSLQHSLDCLIGGFRTLQHNEVRDLVADCLKEAHFSGVETEPELQELQGESFKLKSANKDDEARSDVKCIGFWTRMRQAYFDIKVVSPFAKSNSSLTPAQLYRKSEQEKIREYAARIRDVEHADFSPLVYTTTGAMAPRTEQVFKKVGEKMAELKEIPYSVVCGWLRCRFSFALLRTTLICLRGTRKRKGKFGKPGKPQIERAVVEAHIDF